MSDSAVRLVQMDMRGEWSDSTDESPSSKRVIEHHRGSEFEPSELSQKMQAVDNRIAELEKQKQEMRSELEKKSGLHKLLWKKN